MTKWFGWCEDIEVFDWNRVKDYQDKYPLTKEIFKQIANEKKCKISFADQFDYDEYGCDLKGNYQKKNIKFNWIKN